jgi:hypothetical protein
MNEFLNAEKYIEELSQVAELKSYILTKYIKGSSLQPKFIGLCGSQKIFIKVVNNKESIILSEITKLQSQYIVGSILPELLKENIFIANFINEASQPYLNNEFLYDYFRMQQLFDDHSKLNQLFGTDQSIYRNYNFIPFKENILNDINVALRVFKCLQIQTEGNLFYYEEIFNDISLKKLNIVDCYCCMPLRWLQNDFKRGNLIGKKPSLIDWGESYGMGPFLHDIAPFISKEIFDSCFEIISTKYKKSIEECYRWLFSALCIRLTHEIVWQYMNYFRTSSKIITNIETFDQQYPSYRQLKAGLTLFKKNI